MAPTALATASVHEVFDLDLRIEPGSLLAPIAGVEYVSQACYPDT